MTYYADGLPADASFQLGVICYARVERKSCALRRGPVRLGPHDQCVFRWRLHYFRNVVGQVDDPVSGLSSVDPHLSAQHRTPQRRDPGTPRSRRRRGGRVSGCMPW
jgi:hypothetical protein